ncbi:uncharacterized protein LOC123309933 [Coccinella septempunctata]|uniref:uncharacterized protein LOC123309933 n=1 Tax=Coccinella septempunctata TaxID=41139 RepID=UPI001D091D3D|nr:uncharacterized protein LOC123309933 [Coccinella septempunctata]
MQTEDRSIVTYESNPQPHEILHIKCYVIQFIREQIANIKGRAPTKRGSPNETKQLPETPIREHNESKAIEDSSSPCQPWGWLQWLLLYLLLLLMFLYGAIIGANFCQNKRYGCHPLYPFAGLGRKGHEVVF